MKKIIFLIFCTISLTIFSSSNSKFYKKTTQPQEIESLLTKLSSNTIWNDLSNEERDLLLSLIPDNPQGHAKTTISKLSPKARLEELHAQYSHTCCFCAEQNNSPLIQEIQELDNKLINQRKKHNFKILYSAITFTIIGFTGSWYATSPVSCEK